ncbi:MAG: hypothetical protein QM727_02185 [Niabella sp.]
MDKVKKAVLGSALLLVIATTNFSSMCRHGLGNKANAAFTYNQNPLPSSAPIYTSFNKNSDIALAGDPSTNITWNQLADVSYISKYNKQFDTQIQYPVFGNNVKKLAGQEWVISGYMIPLDIKSGLYALSKNTYAACFFCGAAGVESVISLKFKTKPKRYKTDEYCYMKGKLELNDKNVNDFIYIFRNTEEVKK